MLRTRSVCITVSTIVCGILFVTPHTLSAQTGVTVTADPSPPPPNTEVTLTAKGVSFDEDTAVFRWYQDGAQIASGQGRDRVAIETGAAGSSHRIRVTASADGAQHTTTYHLQPASVDLYVEGDTFTPPLYKGRARYTPMADVRFIAMPTFGGSVAASDLHYTWEINGRTVERSIGKQVFTADGSFLSDQKTVTVTAKTPGGTRVARATKTISPRSPQLVFYPTMNNNTLPAFRQSLGNNSTVQQDQLSVVAMPYFFTADNAASSDLSYNWTVDGEAANPARQPYMISLQTIGEGAALRSNISLTLEHDTHISQSAEHSAQIQFRDASGDSNGPVTPPSI